MHTPTILKYFFCPGDDHVVLSDIYETRRCSSMSVSVIVVISSKK